MYTISSLWYGWCICTPLGIDLYYPGYCSFNKMSSSAAFFGQRWRPANFWSIRRINRRELKLTCRCMHCCMHGGIHIRNEFKYIGERVLLTMNMSVIFIRTSCIPRLPWSFISLVQNMKEFHTCRCIFYFILYTRMLCVGIKTWFTKLKENNVDIIGWKTPLKFTTKRRSSAVNPIAIILN